MRRRTFLALSLAALSISASTLPLLVTPGQVAAQDSEVVVYLVRHAERAEDGTNDPPISEAGRKRAGLLATMLADAGITHVHSTDYKRTRATGRPLAESLGLSMASYDARDLAGFADQLRDSPGRHLVVGHRNTTPDLVAALGGNPHGPIEEFEYDRLYVMVLRGGSVSTVLLRFGALHTPSAR